LAPVKSNLGAGGGTTFFSSPQPVKNCATISAEDCLKVLDKIGNVMYSVPCDMYEVDESSGMNIDLKKGLHSLNSKQILSMLRYSNYDNTSITRESVAVDFTKVIFQKMTTPSYYTNAARLFKELIISFETDFTEKDFNNYLDLIFDIPKFQMRTVTYPGTIRVLDDRNLFLPNITSAVSMYSEFK